VHTTAIADRYVTDATHLFAPSGAITYAFSFPKKQNKNNNKTKRKRIEKQWGQKIKAVKGK
jgi:hypothetical protein